MFVRSGAVLLSLCALLAAADPVPKVMRFARIGVNVPVLWVDAEVAFDAEGNLREELFSESGRSMIEANRRANPGTECRSFLDRAVDSYSVPRTFDDVVRNALSIVRGEVVETRQGFDRGVPATLVAVSVAERLKAFGKAATAPDEVYVLIPEARIATSKGSVCSSAFVSLPELKPGNEIIVFSDVDPMDEQAALLHVDPATALVVVRGDTIHLPRLAEKASIRTLPELLGVLRSHAGLREKPGTRSDASVVVRGCHCCAGTGRRHVR